MATFLEIQEAVAGIIIDTPTATVNQVPNFIRRAMRKLHWKHDFRVMQKETSVLVTTVATRVLSVTPSDWMKPRGAPYEIAADGSVRELIWAPNRVAVLRELGDTRGGEADSTVHSGPPAVILQSEPTTDLGGSNLEIYPLPDGLSLYANSSAGEYRVVVPYYRFLPALSASGDTNWFTVNADEWLTYQAAAEGFFHDHDEERGTIWAQKATAVFQDVVQADKLDRVSAVRELVPSPNAGGSRLRGRDPGQGRTGL
jgi:hypothetical protein